MTILVAYATMNGSTCEIAEWIGAELRARGLHVDVRRAVDVDDLSGYDAVILGGAVYADGWHWHARQFANRFAGRMGDRPVWLFSSGPLDHSADQADIPPNQQAAAALRALGGRGHATFGGRLNEGAQGWLGMVARRKALETGGGDFRNPERVRAWAREIAAAIEAHHLGEPHR